MGAYAISLKQLTIGAIFVSIIAVLIGKILCTDFELLWFQTHQFDYSFIAINQIIFLCICLFTARSSANDRFEYLILFILPLSIFISLVFYSFLAVLVLNLLNILMIISWSGLNDFYANKHEYSIKFE